MINKTVIKIFTNKAMTKANTKPVTTGSFCMSGSLLNIVAMTPAANKTQQRIEDTRKETKKMMCFFDLK